MIKITIHRGTHQIGGCATEIECDGERILIDLGANLPGSDEKAEITDKQLLDQVFGINRDRKFDAVLFSHYHGDHYGLYKDIPSKTPMYIGKTAKEILKTVVSYIDLNESVKGQPIIDAMETYRPAHPLPGLKKLTVTPFSVDHSALDAYMFLIEAEGKRILFTGDFREHGITNEREQLWAVIDKYIPKPVDVLLTEGTMLSRTKEAAANIVQTEDELGKTAAEYFKQKKYNFVMVSSTNLDSIMEYYHNTPQGMHFVCDKYQAQVMLAAMENKGKLYPQYQAKLEDGRSKWLRILGWASPEEYRMLQERGKLIHTRLHLPQVFLKKITDRNELVRDGFVMLVRPNRFWEKTGHSKFEKEFNAFRSLDASQVQMIYSMWDGYLKGDTKDDDIVRFIGDFPIQHLHTSGHAYVQTIAKLLDKVNPGMVIPMHTEMADSFAEFKEFAGYQDKVKVLMDGQSLEI